MEKKSNGKINTINALSMSILQKWRNNEEEIEDYLTQHEHELKEELKSELGEKNRDLLTSYSLAIENRMDELIYHLNIKILHLGIKIGMELEKGFHEYEEE